MSKPIVLEYLKTHTFSQLKEEHGINSRPDNDVTKFILNYDQLNVTNGAQISNECRGLIVRPVFRLNNDAWENQIVGECSVVAYPFNRFYNEGDPSAAEIDWHDSRLWVYDKLDGTMIALYFDELKDKWCVATRGVSEADLPMNDDGLTFAQLFWIGMENTVRSHQMYPEQYVHDQDDLLTIFKKHFTYIFELTSPHNRIVVRYPDTRITLLGLRRLDTFRELSLDEYRFGCIPSCPTHPVKTQADIKALVDTFKPENNEGIVVRDSNFNRLKVKSAAYVLSHRFKDALTLSRRDVLQSVLDGTVDDILPLLEPEMAQHVEDLKVALREFSRDIDVHFYHFREAAAGDRKLFAQKVQGSGLWHPPFYQLFEGKAEKALDLFVKLATSGKPVKSMLDTMIDLMKWKPIIK